MNEFERRKDQIQDGVQSTAGLVGRVTVIVTDAIGAIAREVGDWISDGIEMQEAARASRRADHGDTTATADRRAHDEDPEPPDTEILDRRR